MIGTLKVSSNSDRAQVIVIGDPHYGALGQTRKNIKKALAYAVDQTENHGIRTYVVSIGDNLEIPDKYSMGGEISVQEAAEQFASDFREVAERGLFLGAIIGNHDRRVTKNSRSRVDLIEQLINEWSHTYKAPIFYSSAQIICLCVGEGSRRRAYTLFFHHGFGGGRSIGTIFNNLERCLGMCANPDVVFTGHRHTEGQVKVYRTFYSSKSGTLNTKPIQLVAVGANMDEADYALAFGLPPQKPNNTLVQFKAPKRGGGARLDPVVLNLESTLCWNTNSGSSDEKTP